MIRLQTQCNTFNGDSRDRAKKKPGLLNTVSLSQHFSYSVLKEINQRNKLFLEENKE